jgi:hypothetical protein
MLFRKHYRLHARNFEAFAAAHVLAGHHVVAAEHIGAGFGEAGAIALVGSAEQLLFLGTYQPIDFVLGGLLAMGTIQRRNFFVRPFVKKFSLVHRLGCSCFLSKIIARPWRAVWQDGGVPKRKKRKEFRAVEAGKALARERIGTPPDTRVIGNRKKKPQRHKPTLKVLLDGDQ